MSEQIVEIIGRDGRRRRAKKGEVLADGERFSIPMTFLDHQLQDGLVAKYGDSAIRVVDASGAPAGHRPGYLLDRDRTLADAAAEAYQARNQRMADAWKRRRPDDEDDQDGDSTRAKETDWERRQRLARKAATATTGTDARQPTLDELRARAAAAYEDRQIRLSNAWRTR